MTEPTVAEEHPTDRVMRRKSSSTGVIGALLGGVDDSSAAAGTSVVLGRGLHSSTFWLNVSTICWIRWVHDFPPVY
jgi:hypothetical protein